MIDVIVLLMSCYLCGLNFQVVLLLRWSVSEGYLYLQETGSDESGESDLDLDEDDDDGDSDDIEMPAQKPRRRQPPPPDLNDSDNDF